MNAWIASIWFAALVLLLDPERRVTCALPQLATNQSNATTQGLVQAAEAGDEERGAKEVAQRIDEALRKRDQRIEKALVIANEHVSKWKSERKTGLAVLEEAQGEGSLLETLNGPNLNALVQFFENSPHEKPLIEHLLEKYGVDEIALALQRASHFPETHTNAEKLMGQLFDRFVTQGKSAAEFFDLLKLPHDENMFSEYKRFFVWGRYATLLYPKLHPNDEVPAKMIPALAVIFALASIVGEEKKLVEIIRLGTKKNDPFAKLEAETVESQLFEYWYLEGRHPNDLLEMERYPSAGSSAWLAEVVNYMEYYNRLHPSYKVYFTEWIKRNGNYVASELLRAAKEKNDNAGIPVVQMLHYAKKANDMDLYEAVKKDYHSYLTDLKAQEKPLQAIRDFLKSFKTMTPDEQTKRLSEMSNEFVMWYQAGVTPSKIRSKVFSSDKVDEHESAFLEHYKNFFFNRRLKEWAS
ncbi:hypothetical protein PsorP6_017538 [Peronosclerospora sorghi]|uniref:Uncharacterized protein n=1 Tax=Peronosclerospora sorghi TaxID=230839 RepID=A0ACC0WNU1_9STRA|nr:hypothetical protein PsorP6_017538 [Peronosclerospora sorghi]